MGKFIRHIIIAACLAFAFLLVFGKLTHLFPKEINYFLGHNKSWLKVTERVKASKNKIGSDTLILGDSVAGQFFPFRQKKNQLTTNGSTLAFGNYVLAANAIKHNPQLKTIILVSVPNVIGNPFERSKTTNNLIKPFFRKSNAKYFDQEIRNRISLKPLGKYYEWDLFKILPLSEENYFDGVERDQNVLSPFSLKWLSKIKSLCDEKGIQFVLRAPPVPNSLAQETNNWSAMKTQVAQTILAGTFDDYFKNIPLGDKSDLKDHIHWSKAYLKENKKRIRAIILAPQN